MVPERPHAGGRKKQLEHSATREVRGRRDPLHRVGPSPTIPVFGDRRGAAVDFSGTEEAQQSMPTIKFTREKKEVECEKGANLRQVAIQNGIQLYPGIKSVLNCRGKSLCGDCRVHVVKGRENLSPMRGMEKLRVGLSFFKIGNEDRVRLACQARVEGDIEVLTQPEFNWFGER